MPKTKPAVEVPDDTAEPPSEAVELVEIDYKGAVFTVPKYADDWNTEDLETMYRKDNAFDLIRACIGPDQYAKFQAKFPKFRDFKEFRDLLGTTINRECVGL
jgi:hypothetical protein